MKTLIFLTVLFFSLNAWGQTIYYSPFTQTYPTIFTQKIEEVNRRIYFEPNKITITTETKKGKDVEILHILSTEIQNESLIVQCQNMSKQKITIAIPENQKQIGFIDYFYRSPKTDEEVQFRFHVKQIQ